MHKAWLIIKREYWTRVKNRTFLLATFLAPLAIVGFMTVTVLLTAYDETNQEIAVIDESGLNIRFPNEDGKIYFTYKNENPEILKETYVAEGFDGLLHIPQIDLSLTQDIKLYSQKSLGSNTINYIQRRFDDKIYNARLSEKGLSKEEIEQLKNDFSIVPIMDGEDASADQAIAMALGGIMGFMIYIVLFIYGTMVMRGVMEEKVNRIVEVIISSVKPWQMMIGKIIGIGGVGITQFLVWIIILFFVQLMFPLIAGFDTASQPDPMGMGQEITLDPEETQHKMEQIFNKFQEKNWALIIPLFLFYFLGGYIFYASIFAAIGSVANDDGDNVQSLTFPVTIPIVLSIIIMFNTLEQPDSNISFWASILPFSSPIVMPARIGFEIEAWQIIVSMVSLIVGCIFSVWMAGKVYRTGILLYGKKINVKEIGKWLIKA